MDTILFMWLVRSRSNANDSPWMAWTLHVSHNSQGTQNRIKIINQESFYAYFFVVMFDGQQQIRNTHLSVISAKLQTKLLVIDEKWSFQLLLHWSVTVISFRTIYAETQNWYFLGFFFPITITSFANRNLIRYSNNSNGRTPQKQEEKNE